LCHSSFDSSFFDREHPSHEFGIERSYDALYEPEDDVESADFVFKVETPQPLVKTTGIKGSKASRATKVRILSPVSTAAADS